MRWNTGCSVKRSKSRLWRVLLMMPCCLLSQAYAVDASINPMVQLNMLTCALMGYEFNGGACSVGKQQPAANSAGNALYVGESSFLDALNRTIQGSQNEGLDDFIANLSSSRAGGFSPTFHQKLLGLMSQVATDVMNGKGNRWGKDSSDLTLSVVTGSNSPNPQATVEKVMKSMYPVFKSRSGLTGRFEWQNGCGGGSNNLTGVSSSVRSACSFAQCVKYAQLLTTSCAQSWHQGPSVTEAKIGVTQCGSSFPVSKGSGDAAGSQNASASDGDAFQVTQAGVFQGCSATLCINAPAGGPAIPSHQTQQAQLLNGWADTCQSLVNLQAQSCSNLTEGSAKKACVCLQKYLRGESNISECAEGCVSLRSGGGGDYSQRQACPPIPGGFSANQANRHTVQIANRAQGDITGIAPCLQYAEQEAGRVIASDIWGTQGTSNSSPESAFGSVYTLLGPDTYKDTQSAGSPPETTPSTAYTVVNELFSNAPNTPFQFVSYLDIGTSSLKTLARSLDTNRSKQAELLIALLNGAFASSSASLVVPSLPAVADGGAHFLRNGRFMSTNSQGQVLSGLSGSDNPQYKLQGGGSEVSKILQAQNAALSSVRSSHTQYTQSEQQSARMQILLMSMYYEMFAQRAVIDKSTQLTPQQVRKASATWRLDPTVRFSTTSSSATNDGDNTQSASTTWSFCADGTSSGCSSWSSHVADFSFTELLREATRLLTDMHALQYEIYEVQNRIQLLQALAGAANVSKVKQGMGQSEVSIQQMANQMYAGKAGQSASQGVQSMPVPTSPTSGSY